MKKILLILVFINSVFASSHTFLVNKYNKELELEAKIVSNIAKNVLNKDIKIYIPNITEDEKNIYSKYFEVVQKCEDANFAFIKDQRALRTSCNNKEKVYFTNSYRKLMGDDRFIGAFFWSKSRPNVIFLQKRLDEYKIVLPSSYEKYIENF